MPDEVETMFASREVPWHGLGNVVPENLHAAEALQAAELDWTVELRPIWTSSGDKKSKLKIADKRAIVRSTDDLSLGIVSPSYNIFQNHEAFAFLDNLVDSGEAMYETAGSLRKGRTVFITAKFPEQVLIGGEDPHDVYLVLSTTHDGTGAVKVLVTPIRVVCQNTLTMAYGAAKNRWSVAHNRTMRGRITEARETLDLSFSYMKEFSKTAEELMGINISDDQFYDTVMDLFYPHNDNSESASEMVMDLYRNSPTNGYHGTAWGGLNALSEYFEHHGNSRSAEARLGAVTGWQEKFRSKTVTKLLELA